MLDFRCSPDVSLQDLGSGCVSEPQKNPRVKETHVGFSSRVIEIEWNSSFAFLEFRGLPFHAPPGAFPAPYPSTRPER